MNCIHLVEPVAGGVRCRKNGGPETTCSHGVCLRCGDGGGPNAAWKMESMPKVVAAVPTPPRPPGVGDHLHDVIHETTGARPTPGCGCGSMRAKMNAMGPEKCGSADHRPAIIDWMCEQAKSLTLAQQVRAARKLRVLTFRAGAEKMLDEAIRRGRAEADHVAGASKVIGEGAAK